MTERQKQAYRKRLFALADRLGGALSGLRDSALRRTGGEASGSLSNAPLHLADLASDSYDQEIAADLLNSEQQAVGAIGAALDRIDAGSYGICEDCGAKIAEERLEAVPYASRCVHCAGKAEQDIDAEVMPAPTTRPPRPTEQPGTGAETVPPGATGKAARRHVTSRHKGPNDDADTARTMDDPRKGEKAR